MYLFQKITSTKWFISCKSNKLKKVLTKCLSFGLQVSSKTRKAVSLYQCPSQTRDDFDKFGDNFCFL